VVEPQERAAAADVLARIATDARTEHTIRMDAIESLAACGLRFAEAPLLDLLARQDDDADPWARARERRAVAAALAGNGGTATSIAALRALCTSDDPHLRYVVARSLRCRRRNR
jgi:HEAT repeat protein